MDNLVSQFLNRPDELLNAIQSNFDQNTHNPDVKVGLDLSICIFDLETHEILFAGAHHSIIIISDTKEITEYKGTRRGIGPSIGSNAPAFTLTSVNLNGSETFYLFSDGITDQFGGPQYRKIGKKQVLRWISETENKDMNIQQKKLLASFKGWKGSESQTDDVCLLGFRLKTTS